MAKIYYYATGEDWRKEQKFKFLDEHETVSKIDWQEITPDKNHNWLNEGISADFENFLPIGDKVGKADDNLETAIFNKFSNGVKTNRDTWAYNFDQENLSKNIRKTIEFYNNELYRWLQKDNKLRVKKLLEQKVKPSKIIDEFVSNDETKISWSETLKSNLKRENEINFNHHKIRFSIYRPFQSNYIYFDRTLNERVYGFPAIFPEPKTENENLVICSPTIGFRTSYWCFVTNKIPNLTLTSVDGNQCFPFYVYDEDGSNRRENITDWALEQFQTHYNQSQISKWDIFYYTYALLHHPAYREKYEANLKRELPRIPYAPEFYKFAEAGKRLADLHINYETQAEFPLEMIENESEQVDWRVEKMRYNKDKTQIFYNDFLTLGNIPVEAHEYRLGNRSALDWIVDQYKVSTDKRSGITNDPNREDDKQYIVKLIKKIVTVSLETMKIIKSLPEIEAGK